MATVAKRAPWVLWWCKGGSYSIHEVIGGHCGPNRGNDNLAFLVVLSSWHKQSSGQVLFDAGQVAWGCWSFQSRCTRIKCPPGTFQPSRRAGIKCPRLGWNVPRQCRDSEAIHPKFGQTYDYIMTTCTSNSEASLAFRRFDRGTVQSGGRFRLLHRHIWSQRKNDGRDGLLYPRVSTRFTPNTGLKEVFRLVCNS